MIDIKTHLRELAELHGPSGHEGPVREAVRRTWMPLVESFEVGKLGDLIALRFGSGPAPRRKIMLCAHLDEIGMIVKTIDRGFLRVTRLGGIDPRVVPGLPVLVQGRRPLPGVVGLVPSFDPLADNNEYPKKATDVWIDVGLPEAEVSELVQVGDTVTMDVPVLDLSGKRMAGKAFDDRACIAIITSCLDHLQTRQHLWDIVAVASTQEEVGSFGAASTAYRVNPDIAIALDVTFASQPGVSHGSYAFGAGIPISLGANFHPALYDALLKTAERLEFKTIPDPLPANSGTDAWPIQVAREGIPTALINLPIRNMHTTVETVDLADVERTGRFLAEFISSLEPDFLSTITWDKDTEPS